MKIIKQGKIIPFVCNSCDCDFVAGIHSAHTPDDGENYYALCPTCGADCHTSASMIQEFNMGKKGGTKCEKPSVTA